MYREKGAGLMEERISVIIPVYNVEPYLERCVTSVLEQTYPHLEVILVDDGSPDHCGDMCEAFREKDDRVKVLHKENGGLSDARNAGLDVATGDYVFFVDSDDFIEKDSVLTLLTALKEDGAEMAIGGHAAIYDSGTVLDRSTGERSALEPKKALERMLYDDGIDLSAWAKLYKRELFEGVRFPKGRLFEDAATTYKLMDKCQRISVHSLPQYNYMIRTNSITGTGFTPRKMDLIRSTEEMGAYVTEKYPDLEGAAQRRLMYAYLSTLSQLAMSTQSFPKEKKVLMEYIRKNGGKLLKDKNLPRRDQLGIVAALCGFGVYKTVWKTYFKVTGRGN